MKYYLPSNVYVSYRDGALVFLDLNKDDYIVVNEPNAVSALLDDAGLSQRAAEGATSARITDLLTAGLITADPTNARPFVITGRELALKHILDVECSHLNSVTAAEVFSFLFACCTAAIRLRTQSLRSVIQTVSRRKALHGDSPVIDITKARELTRKFIQLRHLFPRDYVCLYDSLALIEFLARYDVFPTWVFGVTLEPWSAHCWVQASGYTFNESVEEATNFTPVMAI